ncbi:MAG: glycosyltransferase family 2 protein [Candidatus Bilamarchaeaceae archaeon]
MVIILNYNKPYDTFRCVNSFIENEGNSADILVIDNGSSLSNFRVLLEKLIPLGFLYVDNEEHVPGKLDRIVFRSEKNLGYARGNNIGLKYANKLGYKYSVIVNNDIIFVQPVLAELRKVLDSDEKVGVVAPKVVDPKGSAQVAFFPLRRITYFEILLYPFFYYKILEKSNQRWLSEISKHNVIKVPELSGCFLMFKTKVITLVKFLDENTFLYNEELILFDKLKQSNFEALKVNIVKVIHAHNDTRESPFSFNRRKRFFLKSLLYYLDRYRGIKGFGKYLVGLFKLVAWPLCGTIGFYFKILTGNLKDV